MKMHFVSGLPRSGSTLLCAILKQNPRFWAAMTSPAYSLCSTLLHQMSGATQFSMFFTDDVRRRILRTIIESYHADPSGHDVTFDTNRAWTGRISLLAEMYPDCRIICCVRDVPWIIDSVERMLRKNPLQTSRLFGFEPGTSVYSRAATIVDTDKGFVGGCWHTLREAWFGDEAKRLVIVDYKTLTQKPDLTIRRIYEIIGEPLYPHDFEHVHYDEPEYDTALGMPGMHKIEEKVEYRERPTCLPPDLFAKYADLAFWKKPEYANTGVTIIR